MSDRINWLKDTDGTYKKTLRGYSAVITINANGTATLVINPGAITATYANLRAAKNAYRTFLLNKPIT